MDVRRKLDILEAFRFGIDAYPDWFEQMLNEENAYTYHPENTPYNPINRIATICVNRDQGLWVDAKYADFIVKDVGGIVYSVEPATFSLMFEVVRR